MEAESSKQSVGNFSLYLPCVADMSCNTYSMCENIAHDQGRRMNHNGAIQRLTEIQLLKLEDLFKFFIIKVLNSGFD